MLFFQKNKIYIYICSIKKLYKILKNSHGHKLFICNFMFEEKNDLYLMKKKKEVNLS
jgi:hypothetical protein